MWGALVDRPIHDALVLAVDIGTLPPGEFSDGLAGLPTKLEREQQYIIHPRDVGGIGYWRVSWPEPDTHGQWQTAGGQFGGYRRQLVSHQWSIPGMRRYRGVARHT